MDLDMLLDKLLDHVDVDSELARRRAFLSMVEYADLNLTLQDYALFLTKAAVRLGQQRLLAEMVTPRLKTNGQEKVHIRYDEEEGCQIIANPEGCLYLARAFRALALAPSPGAHLSLDYDLPPMVGETYPAMLYMEDDEYFARELENMPAEAGLWQVRDIRPEDIAAFFITEEYPSYLGCTRNRVYPVLDWAWLQQQRSVYRKQIRDDEGRMVVFTFRRDDGQQIEMALDLDDEEVGFITRQDIAAMEKKE